MVALWTAAICAASMASTWSFGSTPLTTASKKLIPRSSTSRPCVPTLASCPRSPFRKHGSVVPRASMSRSCPISGSGWSGASFAIPFSFATLMGGAGVFS
jgi:hypothetical protein